MTELTVDQQIRMKAVEISIISCSIITAATIRAGDNTNGIVPFGSITDIERYIRDGKIPEENKLMEIV